MLLCYLSVACDFVNHWHHNVMNSNFQKEWCKTTSTDRTVMADNMNSRVKWHSSLLDSSSLELFPHWKNHRSLESGLMTLWQKWKHHKRKKTQNVESDPEEDENDYTFTGWVSSCENSTSAIYEWPLLTSPLIPKYIYRHSSNLFCLGRRKHQNHFTVFILIMSSLISEHAHASICHYSEVHNLSCILFCFLCFGWFVMYPGYDENS